MSEVVQFNSTVGDDGVLSLEINLGHTEAKKEVVITIELANAGEVDKVAALSWPEFLERTYGSCAGLDVQRHDQGTYEEREPVS